MLSARDKYFLYPLFLSVSAYIFLTSLLKNHGKPGLCASPLFMKNVFGFHAGKLIYICDTNEHHVRISGLKFSGDNHD